MNIRRVGAATVLSAAAIIMLLTYIPMLLPAEKITYAGAIVSEQKCVIIDAGHGGFDGGAVAADGTLEKDINLIIATDTANILKTMGYNVVTTRQTDSGLESPEDTTIRQKKITDMRARLELINSKEEAIFVSVHLNKYSSPQPKGTQVFYSPNREDSAILAQSIQENVARSLQPQNNRKIKKAGKDTMLLYKAEIPAVIVECGFLSNGEELEQLKSREYQKKMAACIAAGIAEYTECENNGP